MDLSSPSSDWIYAYNDGDPLKSDDIYQHIDMHTMLGGFKLDLSKALVGSSLNPFTQGDKSSSSMPGQPTEDLDDSQDDHSKEDGHEHGHTHVEGVGLAVWIHGLIMFLAFVIGFPAGAILIRVASMRGLIWIHAGLQVASYVGVLLGLALGVYITRRGGHSVSAKSSLCHLPFCHLMSSAAISLSCVISFQEK